MSSQVDTEYSAIVARWLTNCPVAEARRCYTQLGGSPFDRPQINTSTITNANRLTSLQALVWIQLSIQGFIRSGRQMGIDPNCQSHREAMVSQQVFYPEGFGLDFVLPIVDDCREIFHRVTLSSGLVQFRDSDAPMRVYEEDMRVIGPRSREAGWGQINVNTPYYVREVVV